MLEDSGRLQIRKKSPVYTRQSSAKKRNMRNKRRKQQIQHRFCARCAVCTGGGMLRCAGKACP